MARIAEPPQSPDTMSAAQLARRDRLIAAVVELVDEGRGDDLQMKDIAERAGVALGTTYRYFSSKDHLVAAALLAWASELDERAGRRELPGGGPAERLTAILRQALRAYRRRPAFARLLVQVANSTDPFASECYQQMGPVVYGALGRALDELDDGTRRRVLDVVGAVWYHCLVEWVNGRMTIADVDEMLDSTCHLLLGGVRPNPAPARS